MTNVGFWNKPYPDTDYFTHRHGVFVWMLIKRGERYNLSYDRIDAGRSAQIGDFANLDLAADYVRLSMEKKWA